MPKIRLIALFASASIVSLHAGANAAPAPASKQAPPKAANAGGPVGLSSLVAKIAIPHSLFRLGNGLTVVVNEDHKAPVVAVSVWYNVGSKDEPRGKTGFAHLFEHLMFYGSDNVREGIFSFLEKLGATDWNGSTFFDRTNYYETVPKSALEQALFIESDRMGYLLPAVDQKRLDLQRGVVQNEKREDDNQPGGLVGYEVLGTLFPEGHPYHHSTIGSMADLDRASLADVKHWFLDKYGPNNTVIALSGDITQAEARRLMQQYFGGIPRGPVNVPAAAGVPTLAAPRSIVMHDRVANAKLFREWAVPGLLSPDLAALTVGASILGGLSSSRLDQALVRDEKLAVDVEASVQPFQRIGIFQISATVKPGVDPSALGKRLDELTSSFLRDGPTQDEVRRAATVALATQIRALEKVGDQRGKAGTLASSQLYAGDPDYYRKQLEAYGKLTPARIRTAMRQWLGRPVFDIKLDPGDRPPYEEAEGAKAPADADIKIASVKRDMPPAGPPEKLTFPQLERFTLANGLKVVYAQRTAAPLTRVLLSFDAGYAADRPGERGLSNMVMSLLDQGTDRLTSQQVAEESERLGAVINASSDLDRSIVALSALTANLAPSLDLMRDIVERPAFRAEDIERVRGQLGAEIHEAMADPNTIATRTLLPLIYGNGHPYAVTPPGDEAVVKAVTRDQLVGFQQRWLRPDNAEIFIVSDQPYAALRPLLERAFGGWQAPGVERGVKSFPAQLPHLTAPRVVLIDRPGSPQSVILAAEITPLDARSDNVPFFAGSYILGEGPGSRINLDLREEKGWSYGVFGYPVLSEKAVPYYFQAPVQADRTGDSIAELMSQLKSLVTTAGTTDKELALAIANGVGSLPGQFETGAQLLKGMTDIEKFGRPDDYYEQLADRYRGLDRAGVDRALRSALDPAGFTFVVVGDAAKVRPQLDKLGIPVEVMAAR